MLIPLLVLLFSCASAPYTQTDKGVETVDLINEGQVTKWKDLRKYPSRSIRKHCMESDVATYGTTCTSRIYHDRPTR